MYLKLKSFLLLLAILPGLAGTMILSGCSGGSEFLVPGQVSQPDFEQIYKLGPEDVIGLVVFGEEELSGEYKIDGSQTVSLPLAGEVRIGGLTLRQAEEKVAGVLQDGYLIDPRVTIEVLVYRPFYILGEVGNPGSYPFKEGMNVLNAVAIAGGFTYRAENEMVEILRPQQAIPEVLAAEVHQHVFPGDIVYVKERIF